MSNMSEWEFKDKFLELLDQVPHNKQVLALSLAIPEEIQDKVGTQPERVSELKDAINVLEDRLTAYKEKNSDLTEKLKKHLEAWTSVFTAIGTKELESLMRSKASL